MPTTDAKGHTSSAPRTALGAAHTGAPHAAPRAVGGAGEPVDTGAAWAAVLARDATQDGRFVYAVRTTACTAGRAGPSRRPRPENVVFFADARGAATAVSRLPALPARGGRGAASAAAALAVARARAYLDAHADEASRSTAWRGTSGRARRTCSARSRVWWARVPSGTRPALRADRLRAELKAGATVSRATFEAGFGAASRAYDAAAAHLGMTPAAYRRGGRGVPLRYATAATAVGPGARRGDPRGVCA
jgi:AraC family transcriptional regulator of adaptative response/methylated-DNA-[protein]-cysteine methyltransferase